jgi:hypothetical protein
MMLHCILNKFGTALGVEYLHHAVLVKGDGSGCDVQYTGDFLLTPTTGYQDCSWWLRVYASSISASCDRSFGEVQQDLLLSCLTIG